jgi:hydrocephalus-inducing protein
MLSHLSSSLHFKVSLGSELVQVFRFTHFVKKQTVYTVKLERTIGGPATDFKAEPTSLNAAPADSYNGTELSVNVRFDPNSIGESSAIMSITNPDGVEYTCLLYGHTSAPQPQPITKIANTKTANIEFKNPLSEKCDFTIRFDNPCFSLATKLPGPIDPGRNVVLAVKFDFNESRAMTGRMLVSTKDLPPWIYYLHGEK